MDTQLRIDRYRLGEILRISGMATTYRAVDEQDGKTVAVKLVPTPPGSSRHLEREFEIGSRLSHPNLLRYLRCFHTKDVVGQVTELVEGEPFFPALPRPETNTMSDSAVSAFRQLCEAISYLHGQSLVHGSLSPEVILRTPTGGLKLIDLGHCSSLAPAKSEPEGFFGRPVYSSPEHGRVPLSAESDYFVVGVLLVEYLTGANPFRGERTVVGVLTRIGATDGLQTLMLPHTLPKKWRGIVDSLLSAAPSRRRAGWRNLLTSLRVGES